MDTVEYGHTFGQEVKVPADSKGTPLELKWRRRLSSECHVKKVTKAKKIKKTKEE